MKDKLHRMQADDDRIGDVRGRGAMIAVELVKSGTAEPNPDLTRALCAKAHAQVCWCCPAVRSATSCGSCPADHQR